MAWINGPTTSRASLAAKESMWPSLGDERRCGEELGCGLEEGGKVDRRSSPVSG